MQFQLLALAFAALATAAPGAPSYGSSGSGSYSSGSGSDSGSNSGSGSGSGSSSSSGTGLSAPPAGSVNVCSSGWTPQCCATNVLGLASLDCSAVPNAITSKDQFQDQCGDDGLTANCCLIPLLGQGLLCQQS